MTILKRPDVEIAYSLSGSGPGALFIHGVGVAGCAWRPQIDGMSDRWACASYDNRGIGGSGPIPGTLSIDDLVGDALALLDELGWADAHVIGHSMGGIIAHQLALRAPSRVRSLSLLCTFTKGQEAARLTPWILWMGLRTNLGTRGMRRRAFLEMITPPAERDGADLDALADRYSAVFGRDLGDGPSAAIRQVQAMSRHGATDLSGLAAIPTLVVSGEHDPIALPAFGKALAQAIPGAVFEEWAGESHGLTISRAERLNARLREHLGAADQAASSK